MLLLKKIESLEKKQFWLTAASAVKQSQIIKIDKLAQQ